MTEFEENKQILNKEINLEKRSKILEYALNIEYEINTLLLIYLGIYEKSSTKLFGNKAGISFKTKIDLLFDIDVLSKEEHASLELLMNIRNKFLHDIHCNSFLTILEQFDNGIKNRFRKYLDKECQIENEESYDNACLNLYIENIKIVLDKVKKKKSNIKERADFVNALFQRNIRTIDLSFNLIEDLLKELELAVLENPKVAVIANIICLKCTIYSESFKKDEETLKLDKKYKKFFAEGGIKSLLKGD
ncbi:MAG: hypothetical protein KAI72_01055 [Candidatus Pacebacteria bacterium]|nr:hypothetical protein [Candidatus Paceibacterota bacterium]